MSVRVCPSMCHSTGVEGNAIHLLCSGLSHQTQVVRRSKYLYPLSLLRALILLSLLARFYFRNWHGMTPQEPAVYRCGFPGAEASSERVEQGVQLLDSASFEYLFEQV